MHIQCNVVISIHHWIPDPPSLPPDPDFRIRRKQWALAHPQLHTLTM
jgi:hypothetical protein